MPNSVAVARTGVAILPLHCAARQTNPNAMEITGLTVDATVGLYDPDGDDDPETGAECSDTRPLVVRKTALFEPFIYKMHYVTKTGSGQT